MNAASERQNAIPTQFAPPGLAPVRVFLKTWESRWPHLDTNNNAIGDADQSAGEVLGQRELRLAEAAGARGGAAVKPEKVAPLVRQIPELRW